MKQCYRALVSLTAIALSSSAWPLTIEIPHPGEQVMPGQVVWLIVQPGAGDEGDVRTVQVLAPGASGCENLQPTALIQCALTIPDGSGEAPVPNAVDIRVQVTFANGKEARASTYVTIAATPTLTALRGDPREHPLTFDSVSQERNLTVLGWSTDGSILDLRGRRQGTVYEVSNPAVVKVRDDGSVVATGIGTATITVQNGSLSFEVPVIVKGAPRTAP